MRILIVSDTHRKDDNFLLALEQTGAVDMVIHCGDVEGSEFVLQEWAQCPMEVVAGNNDFFCSLPSESEFEIEGYRVWLTHGHSYYVSMGYEIIKSEAAAREVDIVMCGHTHRPIVDCEDGVILINPGSLSYPRQEGRRPSYVIMEIDENGEINFELKFL